MISEYFEIKGENFQSVQFGLENIASLKDKLTGYDIEEVTLAFSRYNGSHSLNEGDGNYILSGVPLKKVSEYAELTKGKKPSLFHIIGPDIGLIVVQQESIQHYPVEAYISEDNPLQPNKKVVWKELTVPVNEDYVEGRIMLDKKASSVEFSRLEEAIKASCSLVEDKAAAKKYAALKFSTREEPVPLSLP